MSKSRMTWYWLTLGTPLGDAAHPFTSVIVCGKDPEDAVDVAIGLGFFKEDDDDFIVQIAPESATWRLTVADTFRLLSEEDRERIKNTTISKDWN